MQRRKVPCKMLIYTQLLTRMLVILMVAGGFLEQKIPTHNTNASGQDARKDVATIAYKIHLFGSAATGILSIALILFWPINWSSKILNGAFFGFFMFTFTIFEPLTCHIIKGHLYD